MSHTQNTQPTKGRPTRRVLLVLCLTASYMVAEAIGGYYSHSLALMADAGHMLADVAALSISLFAFKIAARPAKLRATYGYYRAEVLGAFFNGLILLLVSFFIIKEAIERIFDPVAIETTTMIGVACGGLLINVLGLLILHRDKSQNLNIRGAWLHVFSDALGSIGVVISGFLIYFWGLTKADAITSMAIASLIFYSSARLILETLDVLMEHTPAHINPEAVREALVSIEHAKRVHDLHIWSICSERVALSVHVELEQGGDSQQLLDDIQKMLVRQFAIDHTTIQIEKECLTPDKSCP